MASPTSVFVTTAELPKSTSAAKLPPPPQRKLLAAEVTMSWELFCRVEDLQVTVLAEGAETTISRKLFDRPEDPQVKVLARGS